MDQKEKLTSMVPYTKNVTNSKLTHTDLGRILLF